MSRSGEAAALQIRPGAPQDLSTLVAFARAMAQETEGLELSVEQLEQGIAPTLEPDGPARQFVAERDSQVLGSLMVTYEWSDWRAGWIWWIQ